MVFLCAVYDCQMATSAEAYPVTQVKRLLREIDLTVYVMSV
jgi:hypothetical protein